MRLGAFAEDAAGARVQWFSGAYGTDSALASVLRAHKTDQPGWVSLEATLPLSPETQHVVLSIGVSSLEEAKAATVHELDALRLELVTSKLN